MHIRLADENMEWMIECQMENITESDAVLFSLLRDENSPLVERFRSRLAARLPRLLLDNLRGSAEAPSAEQIEFAQHVSEFLDVSIPSEALGCRDLMSDFIREYLDPFYLTHAIMDKLVDL
jgi:hypothetical protein